MPTYYKHEQLETLNLPKSGKYDLTAYVVPDEDCLPDDFDCYTKNQYDAWRLDRWQFVGVYVVASIDGVELAENSLWGIEYGEFVLTDANDCIEGVSTINLASLAESILPDLISETIQDADAQLEVLANA